MNSEDLIYIGIILIVILAIIFSTFKKYKRNRQALSVCKRFPSFASVHLQKKIKGDEKVLHSDLVDDILTLSESDWLRWKRLASEAEVIVKRHMDVFEEYLNDEFPIVSERIPKYGDNPTLVSYVNYMTMNELEMLVTESDKSWQKRRDIKEKASQIVSLNEEGYRIYCQKENRNFNSLDILCNKKKIEDYQISFLYSQKNNDWENYQEIKNSDYYRICKDNRSNDGRFIHIVKYPKLGEGNIRQESEFKVWQGFTEAFCLYEEEGLPESLFRTTCNLQEFKQNHRFFNEPVYDQLCSLLENVKTEFTNTLVVFIDSSIHEWPFETYEYHYNGLKNRLKDRKIKYYDFKDFCQKNEKEYDAIILFDLITNNDDLINNCKLVVESFQSKKRKFPFLGYYTLLKEYTKEELLKYYAKEKRNFSLSAAGQSKKDVEFVKMLFEKVDKHPYYSYVAIVNTLIGEAYGAQYVKPIWLDNPSKYQFMCSDNNYCYSTNGGTTFNSINGPRNHPDIDTISIFTVFLFTQMGVMNYFREKGESAIQYMNDNKYLAYH